jgi:hypothetical protein
MHNKASFTQEDLLVLQVLVKLDAMNALHNDVDVGLAVDDVGVLNDAPVSKILTDGNFGVEKTSFLVSEFVLIHDFDRILMSSLFLDLDHRGSGLHTNTLASTSPCQSAPSPQTGLRTARPSYSCLRPLTPRND